MEQAAMVYDNPGVHSGRLGERSNDALATDHFAMPAAAREAAVHAMATRSSDPLLQLLGTMRMGAILVSRECRVVYLNEAGKEALGAQLGLALRGDQITAAAPDTRRRFLMALNNACAAPWIDGSLMLSASGARRAMRVVSMERIKVNYAASNAGNNATTNAGNNATTNAATNAATNAQRMPHPDNGLALLCIASSSSRSPDAPLLGQLFGLTGAESALMAAIAGGERLHACAARRGVSLATVRAQLRNVFVKTGAATQSELTLIAWSIPGLWID